MRPFALSVFNNDWPQDIPTQELKSFALRRLAPKFAAVRFKVHDPITCESKVHVVVSLGS